MTFKPNGKEFIISLRNQGKSKYEMKLRTNGEPSDVLSIPPLTQQEKKEWGVD